MRILFISNFYPPARSYGYTQWCYEVAEGLRGRGHRITILTSRYRSESAPPDESGVYRQLHLQTHDLEQYRPLDFFCYQKGEERQNWQILHDLISREHPDVIFVWGMWNLSRGVPFQAEQMGGVPVVYYISDLWPGLPDTHYIYWNAPTRRLATAPLKALLRQVALRQLARQGWPYRLRFVHAICVSHYIKNALTAQGLPFEPALVIHGGTDVRRFAGMPPRVQAAGDGPLELLYAGQLADHKGVHTAAEAMALLRRQFGSAVRLTLLGSGHPAYYERLQSLARQGEVQQQVVFREAVTREQMPEALSHYDVLLFPSTGPDALPRMVQEAMLAGLVVVGTTTGGTGENLFHEQNGLVFEPGDASHLAAQVARLVNDVPLRQRLADAGRCTVLQRFTLDTMINSIETYLKQVAQAG